jgi:hypothetical protein
VLLISVARDCHNNEKSGSLDQGSNQYLGPLQGTVKAKMTAKCCENPHQRPRQRPYHLGNRSRSGVYENRSRGRRICGHRKRERRSGGRRRRSRDKFRVVLKVLRVQGMPSALLIFLNSAGEESVFHAEAKARIFFLYLVQCMHHALGIAEYSNKL